MPPAPGAGGSFGVAPVFALLAPASRPLTLAFMPFWLFGPGGLGFAEVGVASGLTFGPDPGVD